MEIKNTMIASKVIELSEHPSYLELVDRVCYYDAENANGVQLDYNEDSLQKAQSLVEMPVVAHYLQGADGKPTLGGHAVVRTPDGVKFGTAAIGVHTNVWIEDAEVELVSGETKVVKCLFSTMKVWTRFSNMVAAVRRLYDEGRLHNSWEISVSSYNFDNGIKHLQNYEFIGNALLGEATPAYGSASSVLSLSSLDEESELMIAEALSADLLGSESASNTQQIEEGGTPEMEVNENNVENLAVEEEAVEAEAKDINVKEEAKETAETQETQEVGEEASTENDEAEVSEDNSDSEEESEAETDSAEIDEPEQEENSDANENDETSEMKTSADLIKMLNHAISALDKDGEWHWLAMLFPEEHIVLVQSNKKFELSFYQFSYRFENEEAILENCQDVEMVISPLQVNSEIESRNNAIAEANNRIVDLESRVSELEKAKSELDAIKAERAKEEHAEAVNKLREYVVKSGRFTNEEIESEQIKNAINELNESWLKAEIADRLVASLIKNADKKVETSESQKKEENSVSILLSEMSEKESVTSEDVMRAFFNN